jgi:hypothetical protein
MGTKISEKIINIDVCGSKESSSPSGSFTARKKRPLVTHSKDVNTSND